MFANSALTSVFSYVRTSVTTVALVSIVIGMSACSDSGGDSLTPEVDPNTVTPAQSALSIADFLSPNTEYSVLLGLIGEADLTEPLQGDNMGAGWTLFAPSDASFDDEAYFALTAGQRVELMNLHLHPERLEFADLAPELLIMTQGSVDVQSDANGNVISVGGATFAAKDRFVSNGVIHFVNSRLSQAQ